VSAVRCGALVWCTPENVRVELQSGGRDAQKDARQHQDGGAGGAHHAARAHGGGRDAVERVSALRKNQVAGLKFRQQHPVGRFVLDFYCPSCKLAVEVDGDVHDEQLERDAERTKALERYGYHVLRFRNEQVMRELPKVVQEIAAVAASRSRASKLSVTQPPPAVSGEV
jgi:very-short-patch-repair endonuclease